MGFTNKTKPHFVINHLEGWNVYSISNTQNQKPVGVKYLEKSICVKSNYPKKNITL